MSAVLTAWNNADEATATHAMLSCCGAHRWASAMVAQRPIPDVIGLSMTADRIWAKMLEPDWMEAFACHPRIGARKVSSATRQSAEWSRQEQSSTNTASDQVLNELAEANELYEQRFGFTYIVCATGKSADEMLAILSRRLSSDRASELREAAEQQRQIMQVRLGKWLVS
jgi:OHCU decarboxylase